MNRAHRAASAGTKTKNNARAPPPAKGVFPLAGGGFVIFHFRAHSRANGMAGAVKRQARRPAVRGILFLHRTQHRCIVGRQAQRAVGICAAIHLVDPPAGCERQRSGLGLIGIVERNQDAVRGIHRVLR